LSTSNIEMNDSSESESNIRVFAVVDTSTSMRGWKIQQVCASLLAMLNTWPDILIEITLFDKTTRKISSGRKSRINSDQIVKEIEMACGTECGTALYDAWGDRITDDQFVKDVEMACGKQSGTALYDAWGDMITAIPQSVFENYDVQIFILTDGEDNASQKYNLESVMALTYERTTHPVKCNFIQVGGTVNRIVVQSIKKTVQESNDEQVQELVADGAEIKSLITAESHIKALSGICNP